MNESRPFTRSLDTSMLSKFEGLILVNAATLLDGDPLNNYLKRVLDPAKHSKGAFNPGGVLDDANNITIAGNYAYITTGNALVVVRIEIHGSRRS